MRHVTRTARTAAAAAAAALLVTGCGLGGATVDAETASSGGDPVTPKASEDPPAEGTGTEDARPFDGPVEDDLGTDETTEDDGSAEVPGESPSGTTVPTGGPSEPIATVEGTSPYTGLEVFDLRRDGDTLTLEFTIRTDDSDDRPFVADVFTSATDSADGLRQRQVPGWATHARRYTVSGVSLVDRENANRHLVLRDSAEDCLCTRFADTNLQPETTYRHSAQFPAPPADVTSMTVEVPSFPSIDGVAIRDAG